MSQLPSDEQNPFSQDPYVPPRAAGQPQGEPGQQQGDGTGGVIPYKNPSALIGYYLGVFSIIPCFGLFLAVPAVILGIAGLRHYGRNPMVKGQVHAWIAIIAGSLFGLVWGILIVLAITGAVFGANG